MAATTTSRTTSGGSTRSCMEATAQTTYTGTLAVTTSTAALATTRCTAGAATTRLSAASTTTISTAATASTNCTAAPGMTGSTPARRPSRPSAGSVGTPTPTSGQLTAPGRTTSTSS